MSATETIAATANTNTLTRILAEGYGPGAWHGADLKASIADVGRELAFRRPSPARHNIAEIALHHAYYQHSVRGRLLANPVEPFVLEGDDWFALPETASLTWPEIVNVVEEQQRRLVAAVTDIGEGRVPTPLSDSARFDLVLGITCHAVYHAGQIQLIKRLLSG